MNVPKVYTNVAHMLNAWMLMEIITVCANLDMTEMDALVQLVREYVMPINCSRPIPVHMRFKGY